MKKKRKFCKDWDGGGVYVHLVMRQRSFLKGGSESIKSLSGERELPPHGVAPSQRGSVMIAMLKQVVSR